MTAKESLMKYYLIRCEALEKRVKELEVELKLENENKRSHVVGLQLHIENLQEELKQIKDAESNKDN